MKVGLVSYHSFYMEGGVKTHILNLEKEFEKKGIECKIIAPRRKRGEKYGREDIILLGTSFPITSIGTQGDFCVSFWPLSISRALEKEKFDILHFHNMGLPLSKQMLSRSKALNVLTFHASLEGSAFIKNFPLLISPIQKLAQDYMKGVIGVSQVALKHFHDFQGPKEIIPNGINLEQFNPGNPLIKKFQDGKINILFVNRIEQRKGLIYLLKAFELLNKEFSNLRLIVVGEGDLKNECQNYVKKNKLHEVCFEGQQPIDVVPSYYSSCDVFVAPSIFGESFGIVLLEAMASGKPVLAFANQGYKEVLKDKKGGILIPPKDYQELARQLKILIQDRDLRKKMGEQGIKEAQGYSWDKVAQRVLDFYQTCKENSK